MEPHYGSLMTEPYQEDKSRSWGEVVHGDEGQTVGDVAPPGSHEAESAGGHDVTAEAAQGRDGHQDGHDHAERADHLLSKSLQTWESISTLKH